MLKVGDHVVDLRASATKNTGSDQADCRLAPPQQLDVTPCLFHPSTDQLAEAELMGFVQSTQGCTKYTLCVTLSAGEILR